jgi:hypothetical protein
MFHVKLFGKVLTYAVQGRRQGSALQYVRPPEFLVRLKPGSRHGFMRQGHDRKSKRM